ncbi:MAG: TonB-dependent receptor, partial [Gemmatimonadetes bacterium]|nr:TonB-dependent receptor [Gemmatimonadota bacterium]
LSFEGGAAGSLELRTRAGEDDEMRAVGELSLVSARLAVDDEAGDGERAIMIAARRTYLDLVTRLAERVFGMNNVSIPFDFLDVTGRYDERLGEHSALEVSALLQLDALQGDVPDVVHGVRARWGSGLARASLLTPVRGRRSRHTIGISTFASRVRTAEAEESDLSAPTVSPSSNALTHLLLRGEIERGDDDAWAAGYEVSHAHVDYTGPAPRASLRSPPANDTLVIGGSLVRAALWLERRWQIGSVALSGGTRIETGSGVVEMSPVRVAPRIAARWQPGPGTSVSTAFARSFQYEQAIAPAGVSPLENFASELLWVVASDEVPVLRSSIATAGAEHWLSSRWLVGATAWVRRSSGVAHADPTPGLDVGRRAFVTGGANAHGVDISIRRLAGRWTGSLAYSRTVAAATAAGFAFPADEDRRNVFDLTSVMQLGRGWVWSAAYTHATGSPYTRVHLGEMDCGEDGVCVWRVPPSRGQFNAHRRAAASTLDFSFDWSRRMRSWTLGGFVQLRNVLGSDSQGRYAGYEPPHCQGVCENGGTDVEGHDTFHPGLPRLPLIGFRVTF